MDATFSKEFQYKHRNPYHDKLASFDQFVLRDHEAEKFAGRWNSDVFRREGPLFLEIGTGYGHFMREFTERHPEVNFVGLDYRFKRSFNLVKNLAKRDIANFRYLRARGERVHFLFGEGELDGIFYFFPDPWPKARHQKKRLFQLPFLEMAHRSLKEGGTIWVKTDHDDYAQQMLEVLENQNFFSIRWKSKDLWSNPEGHFLQTFQTKFEKIFVQQNIKIKAFELVANSKTN